MSKPTSQQSKNVTWLDARRRTEQRDAPEMFGEKLHPGTFRTLVLTTTDMDRPLTIRVHTDVALPAEHIMYVLWAAAGMAPDPSALLSRYHHGERLHYFGVAEAWQNSANRDTVIGLNAAQFGQLMIPDTELYAEIDPARGWRARISFEPAGALGDAPVGDPGSTVQLTQDPFGIPSAMTAHQTDVLLKASDGEPLTPLEQQVLVQLGEPIDLPISEVSQAIALATLHAVRVGVAPEYVNLIPLVMVEIPYAIVARELFRFLQEAASGIKVTKTGKIPAAELRRILQDAYMSLILLNGSEQLDPATAQLNDLPQVAAAWEALHAIGLLEIDGQRAYLAPELRWLDHVTHEEFDSYFEAVFLRYVLDHGLLAVDRVPEVVPHPTLEYETAQEYADSLISSALAAPDQLFDELLDEELVEFFDPDEQRDHLEFTIELLYVTEPVTRRMSVPSDANLHASIETILVMFGWGLTHLWQLDLVDANGMRQPVAVSFRDDQVDVPLAADLDVATVLYVNGPPAILTYDFGDGWEMLITPVGMRQSVAAGELLAAEGSCPPEDAGGPGGYEMKLLAMRDPAEFQRQFPDFESEEIREIANWARMNGTGMMVPEPDFYELDEHSLPYEL